MPAVVIFRRDDEWYWRCYESYFSLTDHRHCSYSLTFHSLEEAEASADLHNKEFHTTFTKSAGKK